MILDQVKNENEIQSTYSNAENFSKDMFSFFGINIVGGTLMHT